MTADEKIRIPVNRKEKRKRNLHFNILQYIRVRMSFAYDREVEGILARRFENVREEIDAGQ